MDTKITFVIELECAKCGRVMNFERRKDIRYPYSLELVVKPCKHENTIEEEDENAGGK